MKKKPRTKKYDRKLKINGTFADVLKVSIPKKGEKKKSKE